MRQARATMPEMNKNENICTYIYIYIYKKNSDCIDKKSTSKNSNWNWIQAESNGILFNGIPRTNKNREKAERKSEK